MKDYDILFNRLSQEKRKDIDKELKEFKIANPHFHDSSILGEFNDILYWRKEALHTSSNGLGEHKKRSDYKYALVDKFDSIKWKYSKNPVKHFLNDHVSELRQDCDNEDCFIQINDAQIVELIAEHTVLNDFIEESRKEYGADGEFNNPENTSRLYWKDQNIRDFVRFAYGLHHAKVARHENETIQDFVNELARLFNLQLPKEWHSLFSKGIHANNNDFNSEVFDKLKNAYQAYAKQQIEKKNRNKTTTT